MCDHGGGGIVHSTAQVFCLFAEIVLQLKSAPRLLRVSQVVGENLPQLSTTTHWTWCLLFSVALWKGGILQRMNTYDIIVRGEAAAEGGCRSWPEGGRGRGDSSALGGMERSHSDLPANHRKG